MLYSQLSEIRKCPWPVHGYQVQHPSSVLPPIVTPEAEGLESLTPGDCMDHTVSGIAEHMSDNILTLSSSKTPLRILSSMSRVACSNAVSTFIPLFALASTNRRPSSCAHNSASSVLTSRDRLPDPCASSAQRSTLFPTRMHVRCGSACPRTSANHDRAFTKADKGGVSGRRGCASAREGAHSDAASRRTRASSLPRHGNTTA